jgi:cytoskeletal protein CcmA (bactofilin family)
MFSKKPTPGTDHAARPAPQGNAMATPTFSVLGADLAVKGDITASAELHIDGHVEGDITCASLVQGEGSAIHGAIRAQSARLAGTIRGGIEVSQLIVLKSARIHGDVKYDALTIEQGAHIDGRLSHGLEPIDPETTLTLVS